MAGCGCGRGCRAPRGLPTTWRSNGKHRPSYVGAVALARMRGRRRESAQGKPEDGEGRECSHPHPPGCRAAPSHSTTTVCVWVEAFTAPDASTTVSETWYTPGSA